MSGAKCPGQDSRFLKPQDIAEAECQSCGRTVEFWPDEAVCRCSRCGQRMANPHLNLRCLEWCAHAEACLEQIRSSGMGLEEARELAKKHVPDDAADGERRVSLPADQ